MQQIIAINEKILHNRPDMLGNMTTVTTLQAINEKVLSLNYEDYTAEIKTADAEDSFEKGIILLVTGSLTGKDSVKKKFAQTFFLAPQDKGYFVLNDVFRYVEEKELQNSVPANGISEQASISALTPEPELTDDQLAKEPLTYSEEEDINNGAEVCDPLDKEEGSVVEEEVVEPQNIAGQNERIVAVDSAPMVPDDAPKQSYASIVKVIKSKASTPVYVPTNNVGAKPVIQRPVLSAKIVPIPAAEVPNSDNAPGSSNDNEEGHSIYVRNLPYNATPQQLEEAFRKFGTIKCNGIQASPITIGDRQAAVEEKRTNTRVRSSGRPRYNSSGKGGPRGDSFRARGNFGSGRGGYGRHEIRHPGDFSGQPKGSGGWNGDNNPKGVNRMEGVAIKGGQKQHNSTWE
ncbi:ras GTPase-activating protein-binding protein 2-like isoform X1 [Gossypium australe]|uniref:Ras GTPase-activating protein-binding protein 2-like isoform X1 n=1 Tax=Gossypium australe TaxID=47621 RepID=A0A5B6UGP8_9ROSI|nr:ras GTPase-activating protein-binding protein 2-like isoform X1 [Gossypium australe]